MEHGKASYLFLSFLLLLTASISSSTSDGRKSYIIHMDKSAMPDTFSTTHDWYMSTLSSVALADDVPPKHLYTYNHVINGFSAVLSPSQLEQIQELPGHLATHPETFGELHTTHTPKFLGLQENVGLWKGTSGYGDDMIVGIIDTGVWPESESFNDDGMPPVPPRWRGSCETGTEFNSSHCNKKLIGARSFSKAMKESGLNISTTDDYDSPRDFMGHGTHTSSTAAGSAVPCADHFGYAKGKATGMAPKARVAMYKVYFAGDSIAACASDTLAGMDQAIADGVDLMSLSLGFTETPFYQNVIALGAFAAIERGIFVSCSAGNSGHSAMFNGAPWITTVGAGTIDRDFGGRITLGEGDLVVTGRSVYPENLLVSRVPLYFGKGNTSKETCLYGALDPSEVDGKYLFCDFTNMTSYTSQVQESDRVGALGVIVASEYGQYIFPGRFNLPFVVVNLKDGGLVKDYIIKSKNPIVSVKFQITVLGTKPAPQVAFFSSRGPGEVAPWVLKPDILAPGYEVLAGWVPNKQAGQNRDDPLVTDYTLLSGTSMSSPHIVGIAALIKAAHRDWSSAAIRSAMMTTADIYDNTNSTILDMDTGVAATPLDYGSGHVNPNKATDPGLVYDIEVQDYIKFLCGMNYTTQQITIIARTSNFSCENASLDINYPSFIALLSNTTNTTTYSFKRVLTNVVDSNSEYTANLVSPPGMKVTVQPSTISFQGKNSKAEFTLTVEVDNGGNSSSTYGYLTWYEVNGQHVVRSPIVATLAP